MADSGRVEITRPFASTDNTVARRWSTLHPNLRINPARVFSGALLVDNFYEATATELSAHASNRRRNLLGADVPWTQLTVQNNGVAPSAGASLVNVGVLGAAAATVGGLGAYVADLGTADIDAEMEVAGNSSSPYEGIRFRNSDKTDQGYLLSCRVETNAKGLYLFRNTPNGNLTTVASLTDNTLVAGTPYRIRVVAVGSSLQCYLKDALAFSASDTTYQANTRHGLETRRGLIKSLQIKAAS